MANLTISNELLDNLQRLAETRQLSVNELAEGVLAHYAEEQAVAKEIAEVLAAVAEVEKRGNRPYTKEELETTGNRGIYQPEPQELDELLDAATELEGDESTGNLISMEDMQCMTDQLITEYKRLFTIEG
jgi:predicted transcriptional regulator